MAKNAGPYESVCVIDNDGELEGYALVKITTPNTPHNFPLGSPRLLTPIRASRSSAWSDLDSIQEGTCRCHTGIHARSIDCIGWMQ